MALDRRDRIPGAARLESTGWPEPRRNHELVAAYQLGDQPPGERGPRLGSRVLAALASFANLQRIPLTSRPESPAAPGRPITTRSMPRRSSGRALRNHSRTRRLMRLRTTAPPTLRLTVIPSLCSLISWPLGPGATRSTKPGPTARRPSRPTRPNSEDRRSRSSRRSRPVGPNTGLLRRSGDCHPLAALRTPPAQHRAAALGLHPLPESVYAPAARPMRLIRPLHGLLFPLG
jgi:hypothetical protein